MRLRSFALLAVALPCGCQPHPSAKGEPVVHLSAPPAASEATAVPSSSATERAGPALPAPLQGPRRVACTLETPKLFDRHQWLLRMRPGGEPGIVANGGVAATLQLSTGNALEGAFLAIHDVRAEIAGWLNEADVRLSATHAVVVAGYLVPYPSTPLSWEGSVERGRVQIGLAADPAVDFEAPAVAEVDCAAVTIGEAGAFDPLDALPVPVKKRFGELGTADVALSREPSSARVAVLHAEGERVWVHRSEAGKTLITYPSPTALVFGWVAATQVVASTDPASRPGVGVSWATGGGRALPFARELACSESLPVVLELGGERATVGHFAAGETIEVSQRPSRGAPPPPAAFRPVRLKGRRSFTMASDAELLARSVDVAACRPITE